jgi:hypothetical protein
MTGCIIDQLGIVQRRVPPAPPQPDLPNVLECESARIFASLREASPGRQQSGRDRELP